MIKSNIPIKITLVQRFFFTKFIKIKDDPLSTIHGNYMLIEFHIHHIPESHRQQLFDLKMSGVTPIIAHPERYKEVQEDISFITSWLELGCIIQVDAGSPLGLLEQKAELASERIINNGWCHIIGSDSHDNKTRNFCLKEAKTILQMIG